MRIRLGPDRRTLLWCWGGFWRWWSWRPGWAGVAVSRPPSGWDLHQSLHLCVRRQI